jgi:hypothetical protein
MTFRKVYLMAVVLLEWAALAVQLVVHLRTAPASPGEALLRFFSFFTILTNILIGIYFTALLFTLAGKQGFFSRSSPQTASVMYITVVGLIYNLILRGDWHSSGLQAVLHDILHTAIPLLVIVYWALWVDTRGLQWRSIPSWLIYPAGYTIFVFVRGRFSGWYPYPFLDLGRLTTGAVIRNCAGVLAVFVLFSFLFVLWGRNKHRARAR